MDTVIQFRSSPKPYPNKGILKAFVLGCDPTATDGKKNVAPKVFEYVFDLGGKDKRYFAGIKRNLNAIGLDLDNVYVQNLHTGYLSKPTRENKNWFKDVQASIPERKKEFDAIDPSGKIPVLLTSHELYKVLMNEGESIRKPAELYEANEIVIHPDLNRLGRPLIALYRHQEYSMNNKGKYAEKLCKYFKLY